MSNSCHTSESQINPPTAAIKDSDPFHFTTHCELITP